MKILLAILDWLMPPVIPPVEPPRRWVTTRDGKVIEQEYFGFEDKP